MKTVINGQEVEADYLGDGLYAYFNGYQIVLHANDLYNPTDKVYLEPEVIDSLYRFVQKVFSKENE